MKSLLSEFLIFSMTFMYYVGKKKKYKEDFFIENFQFIFKRLYENEKILFYG